MRVAARSRMMPVNSLKVFCRIDFLYCRLLGRDRRMPMQIVSPRDVVGCKNLLLHVFARSMMAPFAIKPRSEYEDGENVVLRCCGCGNRGVTDHIPSPDQCASGE